MNIYMVGLPTKHKGLDDYYALAGSLPHHRFVWFSGAVKSDLLNRYSDKIEFRIGLERAGMFRDIEKMDVLCNCSHHESFSLPVAEALMMKKPVICYDLPDLRRTYGNLIEYAPLGDVKLMANMLNHFSSTSYGGNVLKGYKFATENYSPEIVSSKLLKLLKDNNE